MRLDPGLSCAEIVTALTRDAADAWGETRVEELRPVLETTAAAIWLVSQERLEPTDTEP